MDPNKKKKCIQIKTWCYNKISILYINMLRYISLILQHKFFSPNFKLTPCQTTATVHTR